MSARSDQASAVRGRIAANLRTAAETEETAPATLIAGAQALAPSNGAPETPESGVLTSPPPRSAEAEEGQQHQPALSSAAAVPPTTPATGQRTEPPPPPPPLEPILARSWEKLSITLNAGDFHILETQTTHARAAGIRMRRGGNPSTFLRAALRNLEALRLTNPAAWADLIRSAASSDRP